MKSFIQYKVVRISFLGLCFLACPSKAQQPWSLKQCIDYAVEHNLQIKQRDIARQQREVDVNTAKNSRLPDLNASASENFSFGRGLTAENTYTNQNTSSTSFSLGTSVPLFTGFRIPRTLELNQLNLQAAIADLEKAKNDIRVQVAQAYVQILYSKELCDVAIRQIEIDSMQVYRLQQLIKNGKASGTELAQQEATLAQSRLTATQANNDYRLNLLALSQLLELPSPEGFSIEIPTGLRWNATQLVSPEVIYQEAVMQKPEVRAELLRLEGTEKNIAIAKSASLPSLSFQAGVGSNYYKVSRMPADGFFKQLDNNFSQYVGLNLSIPIFSRFEVRNQVKNARLNQLTQQLQLDNVKKNLYKEIQQAYYNAVASQAKYESSEEAKRSNEESFRLMSAKYEYGKANITEFNEAKNSLMKAESDLLRAKYEYIYEHAILNFYRGKEFSF
ncbi:MAG: TolC family protein [Prevotella sp.]|nr:TolC family protein [Prevotella sp.]